MSRFPQGADLRFLPLGRKDGGSHTQLKKVFEMLGFGIVEASLPLADGTAGNPKPLGQAGLGQANARTQLQHSPRDTQRGLSKRAEMRKVCFGGEWVILCHTKSVLR